MEFSITDASRYCGVPVPTSFTCAYAYCYKNWDLQWNVNYVAGTLGFEHNRYNLVYDRILQIVVYNTVEQTMVQRVSPNPVIWKK